MTTSHEPRAKTKQFQAIDPTSSNALVGVVVCKLEPHRGGPVRGYIAMLATRQARRGRGVATRLVRMAIEAMRERGADEVCVLFFLSRIVFLLSLSLLSLAITRHAGYISEPCVYMLPVST